MPSSDLFDFDYSLNLPDQSKYPINLTKKGLMVREVLLKDIHTSGDYLIVTGFTSLANLISIFGSTDFKDLRRLRIVIGYDPDERVSKKLPHYSLPTEVKNYWLKQDISIKLCGPIINIIEKIRNNKFEFRIKDKLHAKIYVGDHALVLGSSNFSKSGIVFQTEANIRVDSTRNDIENMQYHDGKQIAEYYYSISADYNKELIDLLSKLLKDATWAEALARAIAEIVESKWMKDYPALYQALITHNLWPSQKIAIARAMKIIQDQGRVLIADPTGSGKTKFATALAYTLFHWLWENGLKDRSNALIICPRQVMDNWEKEQVHYNLYNKIESMGKLSLGHDKNQRTLQRQIEQSDILVIDEAHNYLHPGSKRSQAINPKGSTHVILSTATPINKKADDLLRLIELLDIDNLSDQDLNTYQQLRKNRNRNVDKKHLDQLKGYVNQFIVRRTKKELNAMIEREPDQYKNALGHTCKYPKTISDVYNTGETETDKLIAEQIKNLSAKLKGIHYLQSLKIPVYIQREDDRINYVKQRFNSAPALAIYMVRSALRSSHCALIEYLHGTSEANKRFDLKSTKNISGDIISKIEKCLKAVPKQYVDDKYLLEDQQWLFDNQKYFKACQDEIEIYTSISALVKQLSGQRELNKARVLIDKSEQYRKILAFDSTVITLDYIQKLIDDQGSTVKTIVATGQNARNKNQVKELMKLDNTNEDKLIALCSDAMSEGINLQSARALVLLDMPSVLRIIEQRIGRLERMDSEHEEVHIFWPDDSDAFSLKGDKRLVDILMVTDSLIGNNVDIPGAIYDKYLKNGLTTQNFIEAFKDYSANNYEWEGVRDNTQHLYSLIEGEGALIDNKLYQEFKDVDATVKTAVSFVETDSNWSFFAFRGSASRSPKWLFIDEKNKAYTDFADITNKLKTYLGRKDIIQRKWKQVNTQAEMKKLMHKLRKQEKLLLPWKKRRALKVGEEIIAEFLKRSNRKEASLVKAQKLLNLFNLDLDADEYVDLGHFADLWLNILVPVLDNMKRIRVRKRKILTLKDLKLSNVKLTETQLDWILANCQYSNTLDEIISACIIGVTKEARIKNV
jgi:superfamily II DNA or RNA helicase